MTDINSQAAKSFYREVRLFSERTQAWETAIFYEIKPDEAFDPTLISERVYGRRDEFLTVMASAGIDMVEQEIKQKKITLPTQQQLLALKRRAGFESQHELREGKKPIWEV